jgi:ABC-2 type transport system permease protein
VTSMTLDLRPAPAPAEAWRRLVAQARLELILTLRNGEQLLLTLIIPALLLFSLGATTVVNLGGTDRVATALAGVLAVAVLSSAFTGPAISVGFDRRSGALRLLGTTPLSRISLLLAKTVAILVVEVGQLLLLLAIAFGLGWRANGNAIETLALLALATAAFGSLGLALAGVLRAEATLAVANAIFLLLLLGGGTAIPSERLPAPLGVFVGWLPSGALGNGLRATLAQGTGSILHSFVVLSVWTVAGVLIAAWTFKWE